jgi:UDP-3-O-[3-hydroxymyristoyl] glucosamine N-acyltransferase
MAMTVLELAAMLQGTLVGDGSRVVQKALPFDQATPDSVTFLSSVKLKNKLSECRAAALLVREIPLGLKIPAIVVDNPLDAMITAARYFTPEIPSPVEGIHPTAVVDSTSVVGQGTSIGPYAVVGPRVILGSRCVIHPHAVIEAECLLGDDVEIHSHVVLHRRTEIGSRSTIHAGAVIGRSGFGFRMTEGEYRRVPQLGNVRIGCDVEVGANATIDRATFGSTTIGDGSKIDNLVQIAHNCRIGKHNIFVAHVGMSGSCTTGDYVVLAGKVGVADHVNIGDRTVIGANTGLDSDLPADGKFFAGIRAMPEGQGRRVAVLVPTLPEIKKEVSRLRRRLDEIAPESASDDETKRAAG